MLRNFKVNVFEGEAIAILFLQFWSHPLYATLLKTLPKKLLQQKLSFLEAVVNGQEVHLSYLVKSLFYSHQLMSTIIIHTLQYIKSVEAGPAPTMDIEL